MTTPPGIGGPETLIFYGGPRAVFEAHEPTLRVLGGAITYLGADTGSPSLYDVALLSLLWATLNGFLHALALVGAENIKPTTFLPFTTASLSVLGSFFTSIAQEVEEGEYAAAEAALDTHLPAVKHLIHECAVRGIDVTLPEYTKALLEQVTADGHATDSYSRLIEQFRKSPA